MTDQETEAQGDCEVRRGQSKDEYYGMRTPLFLTPGQVFIPCHDVLP